MFSRSVVAALAAVPFVAQAFAASCTRQYTVKEGDICDSISAANNASTYQLAVVNADAIDAGCTNLQVGQVLCLGTEGEDCKNTHVVQPNETCDVLTGTYNINSTLLYANNPQIDAECNNLYVGEVVCVAETIAVPNVPAGSATPAVIIPATATPVKTTSSAAPSPTQTEEDDDPENWPYCDEL